MSSIKIGDVIIATGMKVRAKERAEKLGIAPKGLTPTILRIVQNGNNPNIGLLSTVGPVYDYDWHDFEGEVDEATGYWTQLSILLECFEIQDQGATITEDLIVNGRNLKGMTGTIVASGEFVFVELSENVGGCSADGLGKAGHCVAVPAHALQATTTYRDLSNLEFEKLEAF